MLKITNYIYIHIYIRKRERERVRNLKMIVLSDLSEMKVIKFYRNFLSDFDIHISLVIYGVYTIFVLLHLHTDKF